MRCPGSRSFGLRWRHGGVLMFVLFAAVSALLMANAQEKSPAAKFTAKPAAKFTAKPAGTPLVAMGSVTGSLASKKTVAQTRPGS